MFVMLILSIIVYICCAVVVISLNEDLCITLDSATAIGKASLGEIYKNWEIDKFPYFLKSCYMDKTSWDMLKLRFQRKILAVMSAPTKKQNFVISFTGR